MDEQRPIAGLRQSSKDRVAQDRPAVRGSAQLIDQRRADISRYHGHDLVLIRATGRGHLLRLSGDTDRQQGVARAAPQDAPHNAQDARLQAAQQFGRCCPIPRANANGQHAKACQFLLHRATLTMLI
jgi:hypothetical protein